jgi:hypothetical protein
MPTCGRTAGETDAPSKPKPDHSQQALRTDEGQAAVVWNTDRGGDPAQDQWISADGESMAQPAPRLALLPDVLLCLLLQAVIVGSGQIVDRWIAPEPPCCVQPRPL